MLNILGGHSGRFCDGISRRSFVRIGGLAMGGLSLPQLFRAEAHAGGAARRASAGDPHKAVIMIFLAGGPSHIDMFDLKSDAPVEIRGEFRPIRTNVPGMEICEHLPRLAGLGDKLAVIRSLSDCVDRHEPHMCFSGFSDDDDETGSGGKHPCVGSVLSRLEGPVESSVPPFVGLSPKTEHEPWGNSGEPGFLGVAHAPFRPDARGLADMQLNGVTLERLGDRKTLLQSFDRFRRQAETWVPGVDAFTEQAFDVLTSSKLVEALDLAREPSAARERYGSGSQEAVSDGPCMYNEHFLLARRLVEAGARCVTLAFGRWDTHADADFDGKTNFASLRDFLPRLDQSLSALILDLHERGLDQHVSVVVWGEFGRTPRINGNGGRDHWPQANFAVLAGGGMRTGQVIGSTTRLGEVPADRPIHVQSVLATLYHQLGIDLETKLNDFAGRPQYLLDHREPIAELI